MLPGIWLSCHIQEILCSEIISCIKISLGRWEYIQHISAPLPPYCGGDGENVNDVIGLSLHNFTDVINGKFMLQ